MLTPHEKGGDYRTMENPCPIRHGPGLIRKETGLSHKQGDDQRRLFLSGLSWHHSRAPKTIIEATKTNLMRQANTWDWCVRPSSSQQLLPKLWLAPRANEEAMAWLHSRAARKLDSVGWCKEKITRPCAASSMPLQKTKENMLRLVMTLSKIVQGKCVRYHALHKFTCQALSVPLATNLHWGLKKQCVRN